MDLPRAQRVKAADPTALLYRVEVLERENERVKVHWVGLQSQEGRVDWLRSKTKSKYSAKKH